MPIMKEKRPKTVVKALEFAHKRIESMILDDQETCVIEGVLDDLCANIREIKGTSQSKFHKTSL